MFGGLGLPAELLDGDAGAPWVRRYVEEIAAEAARLGLDISYFGGWNIVGKPRRGCRYPECECDRGYACGSTS